ncbi:MAG: hypothetical protein AB1847_15100 [bacterium]
MTRVKRDIVLSILFIIISVACVSFSEAQYPPFYLPPAAPVLGDFFNPFLAPVIPAPFFAVNPFIPTISPLSALIPASTAVAPVPIRTAAQAGTWVGTWQSTFIAFIILYHSGPMTLDLIENPLLQSLSGTGILQGSRYTNTLFDVRGVIPTSSTFELNAILSGGYAIVLNCILTSPTTMIGTYTVSFGFGGSAIDTGIFNLTLI